MVVHALLVSPDGGLRLESVDAGDGAVPTIVDLAPAAGWDEREAHDLYGIGFDGHEPLRPLVAHAVPLDALDHARARAPTRTRSRSGRSTPA